MYHNKCFRGRIMNAKNIPLFFLLLFLSLIEYGKAAVNITPEDLVVIPNTILDPTGYSGDLVINPLTGTLHVMWIHGGTHGQIQFIERYPNGTWSEQEHISSDGMYVYGEENGNPRKCCSMTADKDGVVHIIFASAGGSVYYVYGNLGNWSEPLLIADKGHDSIHLDIVELDGNLYVVFMDAEEFTIHYVERVNGIWSKQRVIIERNLGDANVYNNGGDYPSLTKGENGMIYFVCRDMERFFEIKHNAIFGYMIPGYSDWKMVRYITNADRRVGNGPRLAVGSGNIYYSWSNSTGIAGDNKSNLYMGWTREPGNRNDWSPHFAGNNQIYGENTGDPYPCVSVFSDGTIFYFNGRRMLPRFTAWNGKYWMSARDAPWIGGTPYYDNDGRTIWVITYDTAFEHTPVGVSGVINTLADSTDYLNTAPNIVSEPDTTHAPGLSWHYQLQATDADGDPLTYSLVLAPETMTMDSSTGVINWTPDPLLDPLYDQYQMIDDKEIFLIGVKAEDNHREWDVQFFRLYIYDMPLSVAFGAEQTTGFRPFTVQFRDSSDGEIDSWLWDFGDGTTSSDRHPVHTYQNPGTYSVSLTITGPGGVRDTTRTDFITVLEPPPVAHFGADILDGPEPLSVQFTDSSTGNITGWFWDFGDTTSSTESNPEHTYNLAGDYSVRLIVTGPGGVDSLRRENYIHVFEVPLTAAFSASVLEGEKPLSVTFTDESAGVVTAWEWYFGDTHAENGGTSTEQNPTYTYEHSGIYTVILTVTGNIETSTEIKHNYITVEEGSAVQNTDVLPREFAVYQNYPNPFNMQTRIDYDVPESADVRLVIFNTAGKRVIELENGRKSAGIYQVEWNGLDSQGRDVPSGTYIVKLQAGDFTGQKKIVLIK